MTRLNQSVEELTIFKSFATKYPGGLREIENRIPPEPDIRCKDSNGNVCAFELVELIDQAYARKNSAMFDLSTDIRKSFKSLPRNQHKLLQSILKNADIFVEYLDEATIQKKRSIIPEIFKFLESLNSNDSGTFPTHGVDSLKHTVKKISIYRGIFEGPIWDVINAGILDDLPIKQLLDKFKKKYNTDTKKIELLAYFESQGPPLPDFVPVIENAIKKNIGSSQFSAVWIYSHRGDKILSHIP